jgi:hypothetical protein
MMLETKNQIDIYIIKYYIQRSHDVIHHVWVQFQCTRRA